MSASVLDERVEVHPLLSERWSPRSFHQSHEISRRSLLSLLEAARWTPSANNSQPWRFLVAKRGDEQFETIVGHLSGSNKLWAQHASALIVALAVNADGNSYATYDLGQAVAHLSIQAQAIGYHAHQMGGFDREGLRETFSLSAELSPVVIVAVGKVADPNLLPPHLKEREVQSRSRLSLDDLFAD